MECLEWIFFKWGWLHSRATITETWSNPGGHPPPPPARNQTFTLLSPKHCLVFMSFTNSTLCSNCIDLPVRKQGKHFKYKYISCKTSKCTNPINFLHCIVKLWEEKRTKQGLQDISSDFTSLACNYIDDGNDDDDDGGGYGYNWWWWLLAFRYRGLFYGQKQLFRWLCFLILMSLLL